MLHMSNDIANRHADKTQIDYVLTRQDYRSFVRNVIIHLQPSNSPGADHNILCFIVRFLCRSVRNRPLVNIHYAQTDRHAGIHV